MLTISSINDSKQEIQQRKQHWRSNALWRRIGPDELTIDATRKEINGLKISQHGVRWLDELKISKLFTWDVFWNEIEKLLYSDLGISTRSRTHWSFSRLTHLDFTRYVMNFACRRLHVCNTRHGNLSANHNKNGTQGSLNCSKVGLGTPSAVFLLGHHEV